MIKAKITPKQRKDAEEKLEELKKKRSQIFEYWRKAVEEGDDRETDAITVTLQLLKSTEGEINKLTNLLREAKTIKSDANSVSIGSTVELKLNNKRKTYEITDSFDFIGSEGKLSTSSPIGKAIKHKREGFKKNITINDRNITIEIIKIS